MKLNIFLQKKIIVTYVGTVLLLFVGLGISLYQNWCAYTDEIANALVDEATVSSALVENSLLDASRILDIAKNGILGATTQNTISDKKAHDILKSTIDEFSFFKQGSLLGLLFYVDENGIIRATNSEYPTKNIDVSDRLYFSELHKHPEEKLSIGNEVIGRLTNTPVFHLALPLLDSHDNFNGILMQQISVDSIAKVLEKSTVHGKIQTITFQRNGFITYSHPINVLPEIMQMSHSIQDEVFLQNNKIGWVELCKPFISSEPSIYVGYAKAPTFGLTTVAIVPYRMVVKAFLKSNLKLLLFAFAEFCLLSALFFYLHKQVCISGVNRNLSIRDPLTNLFNRRGLDEIFPNLWHDAIRHKKSISVLFIDIDHFKIFNDICGHETGDIALKAIADAINSSCKRPLDFCCRWGGEEFVLVLPETDELGAIHVADGLLNLVKNIQLPANCPLRLAVSIGIATSDGHCKGTNPDLVGMADKAMFEAKRAGRGRYVVYREVV